AGSLFCMPTAYAVKERLMEIMFRAFYALICLCLLFFVFVDVKEDVLQPYALQNITFKQVKE
ncbi:MAG: hypothetical protein ACT4OH_05465, partial [Methylophilaceae bacterium]